MTLSELKNKIETMLANGTDPNLEVWVSAGYDDIEFNDVLHSVDLAVTSDNDDEYVWPIDVFDDDKDGLKQCIEDGGRHVVLLH